MVLVPLFLMSQLPEVGHALFCQCPTALEYKTCCGKWVPVIVDEETTTIGYKRIVRFAEKTASEWRIRILDARACPCINNIEGFYIN